MSIQRPVYEPPCAIDLSELNVTGQGGPKGVCFTGHAPVGAATCKPGTSPENTGYDCAPTGLNPEVGGCSTGTSPSALCYVGSAPNT